MSKLLNRTTDDRLDDLLEAVNASTPIAGANTKKIVAAVEELREEVIKARNVGRDLRAMFAILLTLTTVIALAWFWQAVVSRIGQVETKQSSSR